MFFPSSGVKTSFLISTYSMMSNGAFSDVRSGRQAWFMVLLSLSLSLSLPLLFIYSFIHLFIYSFIHLFIYSFIHLFIYSFIHLFIYSFIHLFIYSFIHLFIYSFIHLFIYSFIHFGLTFSAPAQGGLKDLPVQEKKLPPPLSFSISIPRSWALFVTKSTPLRFSSKSFFKHILRTLLGYPVLIQSWPGAKRSARLARPPLIPDLGVMTSVQERPPRIFSSLLPAPYLFAFPLSHPQHLCWSFQAGENINASLVFGIYCQRAVERPWAQSHSFFFFFFFFVLPIGS